MDEESGTTTRGGKDINEVSEKKLTVFSSRSIKNMASANGCKRTRMPFHSKAFVLDNIEWF
jgi:hypothetical protein